MGNIAGRLLITGVLSGALTLPLIVGPAMGAENEFRIGPDIRYFDYEEPGLMEDTGFMYGLAGEYIAYGSNNVMSEIDLKYLQGELDYDGETWGGTPLEAKTDTKIFEARYLLGRAYGSETDTMIVPFLGIGYRYLHDKGKEDGFYERNVTYWYSPLGLRVASNLAGPWSLGFKAEYDFFWKGKVKSYLSDADPGLNDPEVSQDNGDGYGLRLSATIKREMGPQYALALEPYFIYWDIEDSDTERLYYNGVPTNWVVYEPANTATSYGCRLLFIF